MSKIIEWSQSVLKITPQRWLNLIDSLPEELLNRQPLPGEWSAAEVLQHLVDVEAGVFRFRVQCFLDGKDRFPAFFPDEDGSQGGDVDLKALAEKFASLREESLPVVAQVKPEHLSRVAVHGELGEVSLENLLNEWAGHDLMHLVQAEQALMQPFIDGCGAWQPYFTKHVAKAD